MRESPIDRATIPYKCASTFKIHKQHIMHQELKAFCDSLAKLLRELGEDAENPFWEKVIFKLKKLRYGFLSVPATFADDKCHDLKFIDDLKKTAKICDTRYPSKAGLVFDILQKIEILIQDKTNYLLQEIKKISPNYRRVGLLIHSARFYDHVSMIIENNNIKNVEVIVADQLKRNNYYDAVIYVGSTWWLQSSKFVFDAPRTENLHILSYSWLSTNTNFENSFIGNQIKGEGNITVSESENIEIESKNNEEISIIPILNLNKITELAGNTQNSEDPYELAKAKLFLLQDDYGVFLEDDSESKALTVDTTEESEKFVRALPVKNIKSGMFIVLRTNNDNNYIVVLADKILGVNKDRLRQSQQTWKNALREKAKQFGMLKVSLDLIDSGSKIANEVNLRNWISPRGIKTQKKSEFLAIMKYLSLTENAEEIWRDMLFISQAHRSAGHSVKREILKKLDRGNSNADKLEQLGRLTLDFSDIGQLTVFRVLGVGDTNVSVPFWKLETAFELEGEIWQE